MSGSLRPPWTVAHQAPLSMEFFWQEYWSGLPFLTPQDLPDPRIEPMSLESPVLSARFFITAPPGKLCFILNEIMLVIYVPCTVMMPAYLFPLKKF